MTLQFSCINFAFISSSGFSSLRNEIEELRDLVQQLIDDKHDDVDFDDEDDDVEIELDDEDDMDSMIDSDDIESMDDYEDYEEDDYETMEESCSHNLNEDESDEDDELPFPVNPRYDVLTDTRGKYGLGVLLASYLKENGNNVKDFQTVGVIRRLLSEILYLDSALRACMENDYYNVEVWKHMSNAINTKVGDINDLSRHLSFYDQLRQDSNFVGKIDDLTAMDDRYLDILDELNGVNTVSESVNRKLNEEGTRLNVFGKHPGYRKKVMSLPQTGSDNEGNVRDWNDDSVYSEQPFGEKIGKSAPFDNVIEASVNKIMENLKKKL